MKDDVERSENERSALLSRVTGTDHVERPKRAPTELSSSLCGWRKSLYCHLPGNTDTVVNELKINSTHYFKPFELKTIFLVTRNRFNGLQIAKNINYSPLRQPVRSIKAQTWWFQHVVKDAQADTQHTATRSDGLHMPSFGSSLSLPHA